MRVLASSLLILAVWLPHLVYGQGDKFENANLCPSENQDGAPIQDRFIDTSGTVFCEYSDALECRYSGSDGNLFNSLSGSACPPGLIGFTLTKASTFQTSTPPPLSAPSSTTGKSTSRSLFTSSRASLTASSALTPPSSSVVAPQTAAAYSAPTAGTKNGHRIPPGGDCRRRRLQHRAAKRSDGADDRRASAVTISPFALITPIERRKSAEGVPSEGRRSISGGASTIARKNLERQLLVATEKVIHLENQEKSVGDDPTSTEGSAIRSLRRLMSGRSASTTSPRSDLEAQLETAQEQINVLVMRIHALEAESDSAWGRFTSVDEPPPEYV
ncbi:hypothetical protein MVEN_00456400 [Mycena venus]|uniref:Uncharacterized protein n=1 Tax=Mycena venus TaxID=2733690 RepID=A0A8H6YRC1_9AGAR|nr:hypothetical protein MVEN_00456400 [Mycena venus]